ncbi:MAG: phosphatase PAP2 family protein [Eubacteriales bacterium]|nr:phosphatase PAP2 family protein [Eubacteriales bacterium]
MKKILEYKHFLLLLYFPLYLVSFYYIEHFGSHKIHIIESVLDHRIPFIEYFIVPYLLWFLYCALAGVYFLLMEKEAFKKLMYVGMIGMTTFIVVSLIYPNGLQLRPEFFVRDNIFVDMTKYLYSIDTATNVFPSIHVFNSLAVHCAVLHSERLKKHPMIQNASFVLCVLIILSTMFLKQHSVFDVISAIILFSVSFNLVYCSPFQNFSESFNQAKLSKNAKYNKGGLH